MILRMRCDRYRLAPYFTHDGKGRFKYVGYCKADNLNFGFVYGCDNLNPSKEVDKNLLKSPWLISRPGQRNLLLEGKHCSGLRLFLLIGGILFFAMEDTHQLRKSEIVPCFKKLIV